MLQRGVLRCGAGRRDSLRRRNPYGFVGLLREDGAGSAGVCLTSADNKVVIRPLERRWALYTPV